MATTGNGGYVIVGATTYHIKKWTLKKDPKNVDTTTSANTSGTRKTKVLTDPSGTVEIVWDSGATPESVGITDGASVTLKLKLGSTSTGYTVTSTTIGPLELENDNSEDVIRGRFEFSGGDVTGPATL